MFAARSLIFVFVSIIVVKSLCPNFTPALPNFTALYPKVTASVLNFIAYCLNLMASCSNHAVHFF